MHKDLLDIIACPMCKGALGLGIDQERDGEVITGSLDCANCKEKYPIHNSIPNLLPPHLRSP